MPDFKMQKKTGHTTSAKKDMMHRKHKDLGEEDAPVVKVLEEVMARYFKEADKTSKACVNRFEKRVDSMHSILSRHNIRTTLSKMGNFQEHVSNTKKSASSCVPEKSINLGSQTC